MEVWRLNKCSSTLPTCWQVCIMILALLVGACNGSISSESKYLIHFLRAINPKNHSKINWDIRIPGLCSTMWAGIKCDNLSFHVTEIRLDNLTLSGTIDADSLCKLPCLQVLSLSANFITGVIPDSISNCVGLTHLNLSSNMLHGRIPMSLSSLKSLKSLDISKNNVRGPLPEFEQEVEVVYPNGTELKIAEDETHGRNSGQGTASEVGWVPTPIALVVSVPAFSIFIFIIHKKLFKSSDQREREKEKEECTESSAVDNLRDETKEDAVEEEESSKLVFFREMEEKFGIDALLQSAATCQGQNAYSSLYRVRLKNGATFAVKRLKTLQVPGDGFIQRISWIGNLKHPNLVPLVAFHSSAEDVLLIYEYQKRGSLLSLLSSYADGRIDLPWRRRLSIMRGIARGLDYIARESYKENAPHGNIKPSNILLSDSGEPLISEFGIWSFMNPKKILLYSSHAYRAPESQLTKEADVFGFGVILLELLTGRTVEKSGMNLPKWVKSMVREEWTGEVFDEEVNIVGSKWAFPLLNVALKCVSDLPEHRPDISEVLKIIDHVVSSQEDSSFSSSSSVESNQQDHHILIHSVIPEILEGPRTG